MAKRTTFVGLDVHKDSMAVAMAESGRFGEVRSFGTIGGDVTALDKLLKALRAPDRTLHFVYEAGPCGFTVFRALQARGEDCAGGHRDRSRALGIYLGAGATRAAALTTTEGERIASGTVAASRVENPRSR